MSFRYAVRIWNFHFATLHHIMVEQLRFVLAHLRKDNTDPNNYRPIALISCICKTMEWMINRCFVWFLETNNILTNIQCGFRKTAALSINL